MPYPPSIEIMNISGFEKVKSLNAHMKSHAMKARAEAEANYTVINNSVNSHPPD